MIKYGIYLTFDKTTDNKIRNLRENLADNIIGVPDPRRKMGPHITLLIFIDNEHEKILELFNKIDITNFPCFNIYLNEIDVFTGRRNVIFIKPQISPTLRDIQSYIYNFYTKSLIVPSSNPLAWIPHCTIIKGINNKTFIQAKKFIVSNWASVIATIERLELINVQKPLEILASKEL